MNEKTLIRRFASAGLNLVVNLPRPKRERRTNFNNGTFRIDIRRGESEKNEETFVIWMPDGGEVEVLGTRPKTRHLVLLVKSPEERKGIPPRKARYYLGFDEREYFVATLPGSSNATTCEQAEKDLKLPDILLAEGRQKNVKRQGEWFLIPMPTFDPGDQIIYRNEPIARSNGRRLVGKPHIAEELVRTSGRSTLVPTGRFTSSGKPIMRTMAVVNEVYIRGALRHSDHKTRKLKIWHRVLANTENVGGSGNTFLD